MLIVVLAVVLRGIFEFWQESLVGAVVNRSQFDLRNRFFRRAIHLDVSYFGESGSHELVTRFTNDVDTLGNGMRTIFGKVALAELSLKARRRCIAFAAWINWPLTLLCLILIPFALLVLTRFGRMMKRATRRLLEGMSSIYKILQEVFQGVRIVKAFAREPRERRRFHKATRDYFHKAMWLVTLDALTSPVIEVMSVIAVAVVFGMGAYLVLEKADDAFWITISDQPLEAETLLQLYALLAAAADPIRRLSNVYTRIQCGCAAADRIFNYMDKEPKIQNSSAAPVLERHHTDIEFRNVCFSYIPGQILLEGIDLYIKQGEIIAFVGKNGCGKTSLLNLLPRFYDPDHGSIFIDGTDIRSVNLRSLRKQIAIVTQDMFLFDDTIFNNIAYARPNAKPDEIEAAACLCADPRFHHGRPAPRLRYDGRRRGQEALRRPTATHLPGPRVAGGPGAFSFSTNSRTRTIPEGGLHPSHDARASATVAPSSSSRIACTRWKSPTASSFWTKAASRRAAPMRS